jgi:hypothetical protein
LNVDGTQGLGMATAESELPEWDDWTRRPYLVEISRQCALAMQAAVELFEALRQEGTHFAAWYSAQAFLGATANVSKLLKPHFHRDRRRSPEGHSSGENGYMNFLVSKNDAPLLQRGVRNHFEHLDARIDAWHLAQPRPKADELERGELQAFAEVTVPPMNHSA